MKPTPSDISSIWTQYVQRPYLQGVVDLPWFGPVMNAVLVALLVNVLASALATAAGPWLGLAVAAALIAAALVFLNVHMARMARRRAEGQAVLTGHRRPAKHQGLVLLVNQELTARAAIDHHLPALSHCWLVVTPETRGLAARIEESYPGIVFPRLDLLDHYSSQACYDLVWRVFAGEAQREKLSPGQVIADITGGTKPMSLGMIVACLEGGHRMEHVPTLFDASLHETIALPPIEITVERGARGRAPAPSPLGQGEEREQAVRVAEAGSARDVAPEAP